MTGANRFSARKVVNGMSQRLRSSLLFLLLLLPVLSGCGNKSAGVLVENKRPSIDLSNAPIQNSDEFYSVRLNWFASDQDGQVVRYIYTVDPPALGDTVWTSTTASEITLFFPSTTPRNPLPPADSSVVSRDYHTFVVKAVDNEGAPSAPKFRSFTSRTTAPSTIIEVPHPTHQQPISTTPSVTISWLGSDPDGVLTQKPVKYKYKLVSANDINPANPTGITSGMIQDYFGQDAVNFFASWDSVSGDTTSVFFEGLTPLTVYYFAIVAFDEAGAYEPRFNLDFNVLQFRPTLEKLGPDITVFNEFFSRTQSTGGISLNPSRIYPLEFPADVPIKFNWSATADVGAIVTGYRWAVDIEGQDIGNETPRRDDSDFAHWSTYSLNEVSATIGPFTGSADSTITHFFYLEARDNLGFVSLFTIRLRIVKPRLDKNILVFDDIYGTPTEKTPTGNFAVKGEYPMEAEADSFFYSIGGVPDTLRRLGIGSGFVSDPNALSLPGMFAGFDFDTTDYKYYPNRSVLLEDLARYKVVVWYSDRASAARTGDKFSTTAMSGLRYINSVQQLNTLAVYLKQNGKAWLFGEGATTAIANGYWSRFSGGAAQLPYTSGENRTDILKEGDFLYDFIHIRSQLNLAGSATGTNFTLNSQLKAAIPYLPQYALQPSDAGVPPPDRSRDPRVLPSAERNQLRWGTGNPYGPLPRLTLSAFRSANVNPDLRSINFTWVVTQPLFITEGTGDAFHSSLDTLYLCQARLYDPNRTSVPVSDGLPDALYYTGRDNGDLVWFGFAPYFFELDQMRQVARCVMHVLGQEPKSPPGMIAEQRRSR
jgi:hypothetical protein